MHSFPITLNCGSDVTRCFMFLFCLHVSMYTMYMPGAQGGQKRALDYLELELQVVGSSHVGWELNLVLYKRGKHT